MTNRKFISLMLSIPATTAILVIGLASAAHAAVYEERNIQTRNGVESYDLVRVRTSVRPARVVTRTGRTTVMHYGNRSSRVASK